MENAEDSFLVDCDEWKNYVENKFDDTIKRLAKPVALTNGAVIDAFPYWWKKCSEIITQIYAPEKYIEKEKTPEGAEKKEGINENAAVA